MNHEGILFVFHDAALDRMTAGGDTRTLFDVSEAELKRIRLVHDGSIPTLVEVLNWAAQTELYVNIELKPDEGAAERLAAAVVSQLEGVAGWHGRSRVLLSSFSSRVRTWVQENRVRVPFGVLLEPEQRQEDATPMGENFGVHPNVAASELWRQHEGWAFTNVWTVNSPEVARELAAAGVDGIITDRPCVVRSLFA
jgi:glycerophosphoryl diester phosphodiesterase